MKLLLIHDGRFGGEELLEFECFAWEQMEGLGEGEKEGESMIYMRIRGVKERRTRVREV